MWRLHPSTLDRHACPTLPGAVHFNVALDGVSFLRGLVDGEEVCHGYVNAAGLLPGVLDKHAASYETPRAISARASLQRMCQAKYGDQSTGCMDALAAAATCGSNASCVSARLFLTQLIGADDATAWGRASIPGDRATVEAEARHAAPTLRAHLQRSTKSVTVPSGAALGTMPESDSRSSPMTDEEAGRSAYELRPRPLQDEAPISQPRGLLEEKAAADRSAHQQVDDAAAKMAPSRSLEAEKAALEQSARARAARETATNDTPSSPRSLKAEKAALDQSARAREATANNTPSSSRSLEAEKAALEQSARAREAGANDTPSSPRSLEAEKAALAQSARAKAATEAVANDMPPSPTLLSPPPPLPPPPPPLAPSPPPPASAGPAPCPEATTLTETAIKESTEAMEDFLLRGENNSSAAARGMRMLRTALECDPSHAKAWYRFGFLLRRQMRLPQAAALSLGHAIALKPAKAGPSHAEMTLLHLEQLVEAPDTARETELAELARKSHEDAMRQNPILTLHTLKVSFPKAASEGGFSDVLSSVMQERQRLVAERIGRGRLPSSAPVIPQRAEVADGSLLVALAECEASRAQRDVLRMTGAHAAADEIDGRLINDLAGRELPPTDYA